MKRFLQLHEAARTIGPAEWSWTHQSDDWIAEFSIQNEPYIIEVVHGPHYHKASVFLKKMRSSDFRHTARIPDHEPTTAATLATAAIDFVLKNTGIEGIQFFFYPVTKSLVDETIADWRYKISQAGFDSVEYEDKPTVELGPTKIIVTIGKKIFAGMGA